MIFLALIQSSVATAGPAETCADNAEAANPGLSITVALGATPLTTTNQVDVALDQVAIHHTDPTLTVSFNAAGQAALADTMACLFAGDRFTLSTVWLNENVPALSVHANSVETYDTNGTLLWAAELDTIYTVGGVNNLRFQSTSTGSCAMVQVTPAFTADHMGRLDNPAVVTFCWEDDLSPCFSWESCRPVAVGVCLCTEDSPVGFPYPPGPRTCPSYVPFLANQGQAAMLNLVRW